jgi:hypothetical protein
VADELCIGLEYAGAWIDDVLQIIWNEFFENPDIIVVGPLALPKV